MPTDAKTAATAPSAAKPTRAQWAGRILSGVGVLFLIMDGAMKVAAPQMMIAHSPPLGLPADPAFYQLLGAILLVAVAVHLIPRTRLIGAILITGYLGGAIEANLRADMPLFSNTLFSVYLALFIWGGFYLRSPALRDAVAAA